jgi:hypothetical protein
MVHYSEYGLTLVAQELKESISLFLYLHLMKTLILFALYMIFVPPAYSQEVISNAGEHYENDNGSISWTIGEPVIETLGSSNNYLTQGFHQPNAVVPTLGQWGLIICGLLFLSIGTIAIENSKGKYLDKKLI